MRNEKQTKGTKISIWISCIVADNAKGYTSVWTLTWILGTMEKAWALGFCWG